MFLLTVLYISCALATDDVNRPISTKDVGNNLVNILDIKAEENPRLKELQNKLNIINKYAVNQQAIAQLLTNLTIDTDLNETNFYKALIDKDSFRQLLDDDEPKNLYVKLKEKLNRDDIMNILNDKNHNKIIQSFRRAANLNETKLDDEYIEEIAEKMLIKKVTDEHKYDVKNVSNIYWDPKQELLDLQAYHHQANRRIFKGERTTVQQFPFMVSVHVMGRFWCGGVLYWHDLVITSASCLQLMHNNRFFRENPRLLSVRVGSNHSRITGELVDAMEVYFEPSYNPRTLANNIAVIRLRFRLEFSYHRVPKIIRITHSSMRPSAAEVLVLGWGVTKISQKVKFEPVFLQRKFLPIYPNSFCKEIYGDKFIDERMFCAGTITTGEGACDHDAGGPAILSGQLVGIISFGPTICGYPNAPTVFTFIGAFADWIERINESLPEYYRAKSRTTTTTESPFYDILHMEDPHKDESDW